MPKRFLRSITPNRQFLANHNGLSWLQDHLHDPAIWRFNRKNVARAVAGGTLVGFIPLPFVQMMLAALLALRFRMNLPVMVLCCWITNPITLLPLLFWSHTLGAWLMPGEQTLMLMTEHETLWETAKQAWKPLLLGWSITGVIFSAFGYYFLRWFWYWSVMAKYRHRHSKNL